MLLDDRLATVLRLRTDSPAGERTQFRQLLDLLGTAPAQESGDGGLIDSAYHRLEQLAQRLPEAERALILRETGLRLRHPRLIAALADGEPRVAAAAMAVARLDEAEWVALIPRLPIPARGLLRHRRDLPPGAVRALRQLGVADLVLPPARTGIAEPGLVPATPAPPPAPPPAPGAKGGEPIGAILQRIEQFREARRAPMLAPRLPLGDLAAPEAARIESFDVATDAAGVAIHASGVVAPWIIGMVLTHPAGSELVKLSPRAARALALRQPLSVQALELAAAPAISGPWRIDATPQFDPASGGFTGYLCRLRRPPEAPVAAPQATSGGDLMRQMLHELRTPVNAIQGFAEIIQQQMFGPVPHEYRAHAASIAVDAARLLAGFDEVERLVRLEAGSWPLEGGSSDLAAAVATTIARLDQVLRARAAGIDLLAPAELSPVAMAQGDLLALCWRILASAASALGPGERVPLAIRQDGGRLRLSLTLPASLLTDEPSPANGNRRQAVSAGMFGPRFTFRLAAAEAQGAGGALLLGDGTLELDLPALTPAAIDHSSEATRSGA